MRDSQQRQRSDFTGCDFLSDLFFDITRRCWGKIDMFAAPKVNDLRRNNEGVSHVFRESEGRGHERYTWGLRSQTLTFLS